MLSRILFLIPVWLLLDLYFFQVLKSGMGGYPPAVRRCVYWAYWLFDILLISALLYLKITGSGIFSSGYFFLLVGPVLLSFLPKLLVLPFLVLEDISRLGYHLVNHKRNTAYPGRRKFISQAILGISAIPFGYVLFGITKGQYHYKVHRSILYFNDLPDAFDGFTITQLSDIHCGSFEDLDAVKRGIDLANAQNSDLLVFTGDLINNESEELKKWQSTIARLNSPFGVYSILGNHDYGDYKDWPSEAAKKANLDRLKAMQKEMGFHLLLDEHVRIEKTGSLLTW